jgi:glycosyltransferase involved in cell wall biosynthesis
MNDEQRPVDDRPPVDVTIVTPTIPPRVNGLLMEAVHSVNRQTVRPVGGMSISLDVNHEGAGVTRQRALDAVKTEWVAFLDDDDYLYRQHLEVLLRLAAERNADFVYSWFDGNNPFPMHRGRQMNFDEPHHTTMTVMVKSDIAHSIGFSKNHPDGWSEPWEDWQFISSCIELGKQGKCTFAGTEEVTWHYRVHGNNTSGLPTRW